MSRLIDNFKEFYRGKARLVQNLKNAGVTQASMEHSFSNLVDMIPAAEPYEWQPNEEWWNIREILENDVQEGYLYSYICLLLDAETSTTFSSTTFGGNAYKTSDGAFYEGNATHIWNTTKDKYCSAGYKTRYVIVYSNTRNIAVNLLNEKTIWVLFGDVNLTSVRFGGASNSIGNQIIESVEISDSTTCSGLHNQSFSYCYNLQKAEIAEGVTLLYGSNSSGQQGGFSNDFNLKQVKLPNSINTINNYAFNTCRKLKNLILPNRLTTITTNLLNSSYNLENLVIPEGVTKIDTLALSVCGFKEITFPVSLNEIGANALSSNTNLEYVTFLCNKVILTTTTFATCSALKSIIITKDAVIENLNISASNNLSISGLIDLFKNLKDLSAESAKVIQIGATNLAKLNQEQINIALNKNWTLS